jgi:hypothetical protein
MLGAVAQLGERLLCKQEVIGSIPFSSTSYELGCAGTVGERRSILQGAAFLKRAAFAACFASRWRR